MPHSIRRPLALAVLGVLIAVPLLALSVSSEDDQRAAARGEPIEVIERGHAIDAEVAALGDHAWAGSYYAGDGLGVNVHISLAPIAGVVATWTGCLGLYGANEGIVQPRPDGSLELVFHRPNAKGFGGFDEHLTPVRWGARRYLVPTAEMETFVSAINLGQEPRTTMYGRYLLGADDAGIPVSGLPDLPPAYAAHLRSEPLLLHPTAVTLLDTKPSEGWCEKDYRVEFAAGSADGLALHTLLERPHTDGGERVHLTAASAHAAAGEVPVWGSDCGALAVPDASWVFTTGAYRPAPALPND